MPRKLPKKKLVSGHLERASSDLLKEEYRDIIDQFVRDKHGIYALYNGRDLYYIGLASNLPKRLTTHLKDKHIGRWNRFSLYITRRLGHVKELESLLLRVLRPTGNTIKGRFVASENLRPKLRTAINKKTADMLGGGAKGKKKRKKRSQPQEESNAALAPFVSSRFRIRLRYKGKTYKAWVRKDGTINFGGVVYNSPSAAMGHGKSRRGNAWHAWEYKNSSGNWVKLNELRKRKKKAKKARRTKQTKNAREPALAQYVKQRFRIRLIHNGKVHNAWVRSNGTIYYDGTVYNSPTVACARGVGWRRNGWYAWKYKNDAGEWVKLNELRR